VSVARDLDVGKVRSITELCCLRIKVDAWNASEGQLQCKRCQRFGHTLGLCTLVPSRGSRLLILARKPSVVSGTSIWYSPFILARACLMTSRESSRGICVCFSLHVNQGFVTYFPGEQHFSQLGLL
jgi:hypothetical protein